MTTQNSVRSQGEPSQVVVEEKDTVVSKEGSMHVPVKKSITVKRKIKKSTTIKPETSVQEVSGKSDHRYDFEEREEISEKKDNRGDLKDKIQPEHGSNRGEPPQIIPQVQGASEPDEMPVSTETSDEKSKTTEKEDEFDGASQDYLRQIFVDPERSSAKSVIIKKIDGTKKKPLKIQIDDLLRYRWFSCTESNYGWEWKFLPEGALKSIAYVRYMDEDPAIYGSYKYAANVIMVRLEGRACNYKPYYVNKWVPLVLYPIKTGQDRRSWWGNFFVPIED
ncbi:MAG: hypothetical protein ABIF87_16420 [Pseudomonadota bacterium]